MITLTRTILDKNQKDLSDEEKKAVSAFEENRLRLDETAERIEKQLAEDCVILNSGYEKLNCPGRGWIYPFRDMCYALEDLNLQYAKYGLKIVFSQIKEKFGTFTGYYEVINVPAGWRRPACAWFKFLESKLSKINFGMTRIVDEPAYITIEWRECSAEDFEKRCDHWHRPISDGKWRVVENPSDATDNNITYFRKDGDIFFRSISVHHPMRMHYEPTKNRLAHKALNVVRRLKTDIECAYQESPARNVVREVLSEKAGKIIGECEKECMNRCMDCGCRVGEGEYDAARCETHGWITYICDKCAVVGGGLYYNQKTGKWMKELAETENPYKHRENMV